MDKGWTQLPLFVIFLLFLSNAHGFRGEAHSNSHHRWGQPSDKTFSPRAVQSSVSEVPVTGILPEEVGSSLFTNRPLKRLNLLQFVKGRVSSRHESTSHAQTAPSSSVLTSLPLPLNEWYAGSLTSLQGSSESAATDTASVSTPGESTSFPAILGTSGLSTSDQSSPSLYMSSSLETSGAESAEATLPAFSQESISYSSSSAPGATYTSQGSSVLTSEGSGQSISPQGESSYSGLSQSQGALSQNSPDSYNVLSSSSVSSQSTNVQSSPSVSTSTQSRSGTQLTSSNLFPVQGGSSTSSLYLKPQGTLGLYAPAKYVSFPMSSYPAVYSQSKSSSGALFGGSTGFASQGMSSTYSGSVQPQGTTSQFASGSPSSYPGVLLSSPQGASSQSATVQSSRKQFTSSYGTQSGFLKPFPLQGSTTYGGSLQPQGTTSQFASGSLSSYPSVSLSSPQGASSQSATVQSSRKQFTSTVTGNSGTQEGSSAPLNLQGSTTYGGSLQPQDTTSQFGSGSLSSYPSVSLSSPQGASSQSATVQSSRKRFTSNYGTQSGSLKPFPLQGSTTYGGSLQPQDTKSQFGSGSLSSYPSVSLSSPQGTSSQSATVQSSQKQFTSSYGTQSGFTKPFPLQGSTTYGGSLQPQGTTSQFASGSSFSYPSVSLSSPQGASSQSATVQSSRKQFSSSYGTQSGFTKPFPLQGSTTYGGSLQPQGTTSQFASGSLSSYPSVLLSSPQGASSQSATVQSSRKQFTSTVTGTSGTQEGSSAPLNLQGSTTYGGSLQPQDTTSQFGSGSLSSYPSVSLSSPQGASSQSATVQSSRKQFTSSYGTQSGFSKPFPLQESTTYSGSLQPQGTTSQFGSGSLSSYPSVSLSSPQGASSQSATVQSSQQFTSTVTGNSGTQEGSSAPLNLQGSTTYGGSLQPQDIKSQFASGSPSSYPSVLLFSPQHPASQSAIVQSSRKQFTSSYGTQSGFSKPFPLQGSTTYGGSLQPQDTKSQFGSGSLSSYPSVSLSSPQGTSSQSATVQSPWKQFTSTVIGNSDQSRKAFQSYSVSQSQKSQRWQPSRGIQASGAAASQGSSLSQSSPMQSLFPSLSSAGGSSSGDPGLFFSAQGGGSRYGGYSLHSQSPSSKYTPGSHAYAKLGSSPLAVSSQSTSDKRSNGLYSSDSLRTQGLIGVVERPSSQAPDYTSSNQISVHFGTMQRPTGLNLNPSLGLSAQASSVGMFSGIPQTAQALRESGSDVQLYIPFLNPRYSVKG